MTTHAERMAKVVESNLATFGEPVTLTVGGVDYPVTGLPRLDHAGARVSRMDLEVFTPAVLIRTEDAETSGVELGAEVLIRGRSYRVTEDPKPDGHGLTELTLQEA